MVDTEEKKDDTAEKAIKMTKEDYEKYLVNIVAIDCFNAVDYGVKHGLSFANSMELLYEGVSKFVDSVKDYVASAMEENQNELHT